MKRRDLIRHLEGLGCRLLREGGRHSVLIEPVARKVSTLPRHSEINEHLARKICRDLGVPEPQALVVPLEEARQHSALRQPVVELEAGHPAELAGVAGDQRQAAAQGLGGDQQVVAADR